MEIRIIDEGNNVSKIFGKLIITNETINKYLTCEIDETSNNIKNATVKENIVIGLKDNNYNYISYKDLIYSLNETDFNNYIKTIDEDTEEFDDHYGEIIVNKDDKTISVRKLIYQSELKENVKDINYDSLLKYYKNNEYRCSLG